MALTKAIAYGEVSQLIGTGATIVFSLLAAIGVLGHTDDWIQCLLRVTIYTAAIVSTNKMREVADPVTEAANAVAKLRD